MYYSPDKKNSLSLDCDPYLDQHKYELSVEDIEIIFYKDLYREVIESKAFERLKDIMFLGSIDYVLDVKNDKTIKRHNRYQHSLGVARLALQFSKQKKLSEEKENLCVVSALLHDIGHAPLSHSLESVFKEHFGIGHHKAGEAIVKGDVEIGKGLHKTLTKWNINPFEILSIIDGKGRSPFNDIFGHAINIDTIEGISRSNTYINQNTITYPPAHILNALISLSEDSCPVLDRFWSLKNEVYSELINHKIGVHADFICQDYMRTHTEKFKKEYYFGDEKILKKNHSDLFERLTEIGNGGSKYSAKMEVPCIKRKFFIDESVVLETIGSIDKRYRQEKTNYSYNIRI